MTREDVAIGKRLERLERQHRRMKLAGLGFVIVTGMVGVTKLVGASKPVRADAGEATAVRAAEFVLVDAQGRERATLKMYKGEPMLVMNQANGSFVAGLGVASDGPEVVLDDLNGKTRARLIVSSKGPTLFVNDVNEQPRVMLDALPNGPELDLFGANGRRRAALGALSDEPGLGLYDAQGFGANIGITDIVTSANGHKHRTSAASIVLLGRDREVLWTAPPRK